MPFETLHPDRKNILWYSPLTSFEEHTRRSPAIEVAA